MARFASGVGDDECERVRELLLLLLVEVLEILVKEVVDEVKLVVDVVDDVVVAADVMFVIVLELVMLLLE